MLSVKKIHLDQMLVFFLGLLLLQPSQAADLILDENTTDRASLTQATLELQRDLILAQEKILAAEKHGLAIYLDFDDPVPSGLDQLRISLDGEVIVDIEFEKQQLDKLSSGGIQKLLTTELAPGSYELVTRLKAGNKHITKTINLNKETTRVNLKVTITSLLRKQTPEIFFDYESWEPQQ